MRAALFILLLAWLPLGTAAEPQWIAAFGRATESQETDIVRLAYRHPLPNSEAWWRPTHVQLGGSVWQVPDIRGSTRRLDLNATAIWRNERPWGYPRSRVRRLPAVEDHQQPGHARALGVRVRLAHRRRLFSSEKPRGRTRAAAPFERRPQAAERRHRPGARPVHLHASRLIRRRRIHEFAEWVDKHLPSIGARRSALMGEAQTLRETK